MGDLSVYLHFGQEEARKLFYASPARVFVMNMSRRWGKSWMACAIAIESALRKPGAQIRYATPTAKMARNIVEPHFKALLQKAPAECQPVYRRQQSVWEFPNGSEVHVAGCDAGGAERLRGVSTDLGIVDEAGFVQDNLESVVHDILLPQTLTTDGKILLISTPPRTPAHPFFTYCERAEGHKAYLKATIFDAPHITPQMVEEYCRESGGANSTTWRREYLAEFVTDEHLSVIPEFAPLADEICIETKRPPRFETYVSLDVGFYDMAFCVFAHLDFRHGRLVIEDEVVMNRSTSEQINEKIEAKQKALWGDKRPLQRVVDAPAITIADMSAKGSIWTASRKDDKMAALNRLRLAVANRELIIHPRCVKLIAHLRYAIWNRSRSSYTRSADHGHFDGVDAAVYLVRSVDWHKNPYPHPLDGITEDNHFVTGRDRHSEKEKSLLRLVTPSKRRRR